MRLNGFAKYAWGVLLYNLFVIMWGAYVRATGSGAGCGEHWPTCQGVLIPRAPEIETMIEYSHRVTSGLSLVSVVVLLILAYRLYPKNSPVLLGAWLSMIFMVVESLLGASLVLLRLVAENVSMLRVYSMGIHLANTFMLIGSIALCAWWASGGKGIDWKGSSQNDKNRLWIAWVLVVFIGVTGAVTALGDTLFPVEDLNRVTHEASMAREVLISLRWVHPIVALVVGVYLSSIFIYYKRREQSPVVDKIANAGLLLYLFQLVLGFLNVVLMVPVWLQMFHLFIADLIWISLVLLSAAVLKKKQEAAPA